MTKKEKALIYFKDLRERKFKDYSLIFSTAPKNSVVYEAASAEIEIYDIAIKALEQESEQEAVLDKIRDEIAQTANEEQKHDEKWAIGLKYAVKIIDKYKAEIEPQT